MGPIHQFLLGATGGVRGQAGNLVNVSSGKVRGIEAAG